MQARGTQDRLDDGACDLEEYKSKIDLAAFARDRYGYHPQEWQSTSGIRVLKNMLTQHTIVVARDVETRHWIYSTLEPDTANAAPLQQERGTIVDFVQHRSREHSHDVVHRECGSWTSRGAQYVPGPAKAKEPTQDPRTQYTVAKVVGASRCLAKYGLRRETQAHPRFQDTWRVDDRGRVLFPHHDPQGIQGFEVRGEFVRSGFQGEGRLWHSRLHKDDLVLVCAESAINALSYHQLHQRSDTRYLSTGGPVFPTQAELLTQAAAKLPNNGVVVLAFDNDNYGNECAAIAAKVVAGKGVRVCRHAPPMREDTTSWNDIVKNRERSYIQALRQQPARFPQRSPREPELAR